jgi:hypothetical protein
VDSTITYLNTDLDLASAEDLQPLVAALQAAGTFPLHITRGEDSLWHATLETEAEHSEPEMALHKKGD